MTDSERFLFQLRNALTPLKASISLLARDWDSLGEDERRDMAMLAYDQMKVVDELLTQESRHREDQAPE